MNNETLFDLPPAEVPVKVSTDRARTIRQKAALADNRHPLMGGPLRTDPAETCGTCVNHVVNHRAKLWHKCRLNHTGGPATDIRVGWPGCSKWEQA